MRLREYVNRSHKNRKQQLTALYHHVYAVDNLRDPITRSSVRPLHGVDGVTWQQYGENLEENLKDFSERLQKGAYRAKPVRRTYITEA